MIRRFLADARQNGLLFGDREGDPSLATFAKASAAEALGMTLHLFKGGEERERFAAGKSLPFLPVPPPAPCHPEWSGA
jgi:hypothetical protein